MMTNSSRNLVRNAAEKVSPRRTRAVLIVACVLLTVPCGAIADERAPWRFVADDDGVLVAEGTNKVMFYQRRTKIREGGLACANYIHPLFDLDGRELTEDAPADHRHHRGVFWAWHQTWIGDKRVGDAWALKDFAWDVRELTTAETDDVATLRTKVLWTSPSWLDDAGQRRPFVREEAEIRVHRAANDSRAIDFKLQLVALEPNVRIGGSEDDKGYGGFSPRIRLPDRVRFVGAQGDVTPQIGQVDAGRWLDVVGRFGDGPAESGVAILCHHSLPTFPPKWILRNKASMQNAVYPGREPVALPTDQPLVLKYRLIVHRGVPEPDRVETWQREFGAK